MSLEKINDAHEEDEPGLRASAEYVEALVRAEEASGIPTSRHALRRAVPEFRSGTATSVTMLSGRSVDVLES